jgi:hypothetical protein
MVSSSVNNVRISTRVCLGNGSRVTCNVCRMVTIFIMTLVVDIKYHRSVFNYKGYQMCSCVLYKNDSKQ